MTSKEAENYKKNFFGGTQILNCYHGNLLNLRTRSSLYLNMQNLLWS